MRGGNLLPLPILTLEGCSFGRWRTQDVLQLHTSRVGAVCVRLSFDTQPTGRYGVFDVVYLVGANLCRHVTIEGLLSVYLSAVGYVQLCFSVHSWLSTGILFPSRNIQCAETVVFIFGPYHRESLCLLLEPVSCCAQILAKRRYFLRLGRDARFCAVGSDAGFCVAFPFFRGWRRLNPDADLAKSYIRYFS